MGCDDQIHMICTVIDANVCEVHRLMDPKQDLHRDKLTTAPASRLIPFPNNILGPALTFIFQPVPH